MSIPNNTTRHRRNRRAGFTLVEALATLMLIAIVMPFIMRGMTVSTQAAALADHKAEAIALAEVRLAEVIAEGDWEQGNDYGDFDETYGDNTHRYEWFLLVEDWTSTTFSEVTLVVTWQQRRQTQQVKISTLVYPEGR